MIKTDTIELTPIYEVFNAYEPLDMRYARLISYYFMKYTIFELMKNEKISHNDYVILHQCLDVVNQYHKNAILKTSKVSPGIYFFPIRGTINSSVYAIVSFTDRWFIRKTITDKSFIHLIENLYTLLSQQDEKQITQAPRRLAEMMFEMSYCGTAIGL